MAIYTFETTRVGTTGCAGGQVGGCMGFYDSLVQDGYVIAVFDGFVASTNSCGQQQFRLSIGHRLTVERLP